MDKKNYKLFGTLLVLVSLTAGALLYYFKVYKKNLEEPDYYSAPDSIFQRLKENPSYLVEENLLQINSLALVEYFRTRMLYYSYTNPGASKENFKEELERDFPGERGRALVELLDAYLRFEKQKEKVLALSDLDSYEKILKIEMLRIELFGENLDLLLYPKKDSETIERFYAYTERYLKKHYTDMPRSKKNHLNKARREIYGEDYERLFALESARLQFNLELKINERELSILNEYEKKQAIAALREKMGKDD
jgi:hypothetical protein